MRLTSKGRYAVMAMADLAGCEGGLVRLQEIADRQRISIAYLEQLFARLRRAGLVEGVRGPGGGYRLARPAAEMTMSEIISAADEPIRVLRCRAGGKGCTGGSERCIAHDLWDELGSQINNFLSGVSLEDVRLRRVSSRVQRPSAADTWMTGAA